MTKPIRITIRGRDCRGNDAPLVQHSLCQIQDFLAIFYGVERARYKDGKCAIEYRFTDASRNSPLTFEITPYPAGQMGDIGDRVEAIFCATSSAFAAWMSKKEPPFYLSDQLLGKAEKIFQRALDGLAETKVDLSGYKDVPGIEVTGEVAGEALKHLTKMKSRAAVPYRELGSVEGFITKVERDGHDRLIVWVKRRIDLQSVKCVVREQLFHQIGHYEVGKVLNDMRIQVFGMMYFKDLDRIEKVDVDQIRIFDAEKKFPGFEDIIDPNFTDGVEASAYLRELRNHGWQPQKNLLGCLYMDFLYSQGNRN